MFNMRRESFFYFDMDKRKCVHEYVKCSQSGSRGNVCGQETWRVVALCLQVGDRSLAPWLVSASQTTFAGGEVDTLEEKEAREAWQDLTNCEGLFETTV